MATVYLAHDLRHDRPVALKLLHAELAGALGPDRFLREIAIAALQRHPNILPLFDSGTTATFRRPCPSTPTYSCAPQNLTSPMSGWCGTSTRMHARAS
jgi:serine/threonine protein kinase